MEGGSTAARKLMVVDDTLILFHVENPNARKNPFNAFFRKPNNGGGATSNCHPCTSVPMEGGKGEATEFLDEMKEACMVAKPKMKVVVTTAGMAEGKDKASVILAKSAAYRIDLLIIGHKKTFSDSMLGVKRGRSMRETAEFLILNSKCTCVAVQKKGQNGGYLLSSKNHKSFWLLA